MEYKRLTTKDESGDIILNCQECQYHGLFCMICTDYHCINALKTRLAELEDRIENGTLIELPCKVGDTAYHLSDKTVLGEVVVKTSYSITNNKIDLCNSCIYTNDIGDKYYNYYRLSKLGKSLFLTKAEAEKKLLELRGEV